MREITDPIVVNMELLMQARSRWKSDDLVKQGKIVERFDAIMTDYKELREFVETGLSPLLVCLLETQLMQLSVEQQDDFDRQ